MIFFSIVELEWPDHSITQIPAHFPGIFTESLCYFAACSADYAHCAAWLELVRITIRFSLLCCAMKISFAGHDWTCLAGCCWIWLPLLCNALAGWVTNSPNLQATIKSQVAYSAHAGFRNQKYQKYFGCCISESSRDAEVFRYFANCTHTVQSVHAVIRNQKDQK